MFNLIGRSRYRLYTIWWTRSVTLDDASHVYLKRYMLVHNRGEPVIVLLGVEEIRAGTDR